MTRLIAQQFIKPILQSLNDAPLPERIARLPRWPLREVVVGDVPWEDFRDMARHSLAPFAESRLRYDLADEVRLADYHFGRNTGFSGVYDFVENHDVVILDLCRKRVDNSYHGAVVQMAISRARDLKRALWVSISNTSRVYPDLGTDVFQLLGPISKSLELR